MSDLDAILDAALDDFDAESTPAVQPVATAPINAPIASASSSAAPNAANSATQPPNASSSTSSSSASSLPPASAFSSDPALAFQQLLATMSDAELERATHGARAQAGGAEQSPESLKNELAAMRDMLLTLDRMHQSAGQSASAAASPQALASPTPAVAASSSAAVAPPSASSVVAGPAGDPFADAIRMISDGARSMPPGGPAGFDMSAGGDAAMEQMLTKLMAEMGVAGGADGAAAGANGAPTDDAAMNAMIEQMMGTMLSKEHLYQPMKDIALKYPVYIAEHRATLSETDLENYQKQQACFEKIVLLFETEANPSMKIMNLMTEMQNFGTPPKEVVGDFTPPGFDANAPGGMPPGLAAMMGAPDAAGAGGAPSKAEMEAFGKMADECKMQ